MGDVNRDLNGRRGRVLGMDVTGDGMQVITAQVPAGGAVQLRHRAALADRRPRHLHRDARPLRGRARRTSPRRSSRPTRRSTRRPATDRRLGLAGGRPCHRRVAPSIGLAALAVLAAVTTRAHRPPAPASASRQRRPDQRAPQLRVGPRVEGRGAWDSVDSGPRGAARSRSSCPSRARPSESERSCSCGRSRAGEVPRGRLDGRSGRRSSRRSDWARDPSGSPRPGRPATPSRRLRGPLRRRRAGAGAG